jgi:hypothetical protein
MLETKIVGVHRSPDKNFARRQNVTKPGFFAEGSEESGATKNSNAVSGKTGESKWG